MLRRSAVQGAKKLLAEALRLLATLIRRGYAGHPDLHASLIIVPTCGWSVEEENARGSDAGKYSVRRYPFPFRCAVSINNDTDGMNFAAFTAFHAYVSGTGETRFGPGLGLEVGNSFWIWSNSGQLSLYHASPWEREARSSPEHDRVLELARAGWLDSLHGFGAWHDPRPLSRSQVAQALDHLASREVRLQVYTSHGGLNMAHNIGGPWGYYQHADDPDHPAYCMDLLADYGFRYYWTDVMYELDKFGEDLRFSSQRELDAAVARHDFARYFDSNDPQDFSRSRPVFPGIDAQGQTAWRRALFNRVLVPLEVRDGRQAYFFKRFRGHDGPCAGNFVLQVNPQSLDDLEAREGSVVVYQHFGVWRALLVGKGHISGRQSLPESVLDEHNIWSFRTLAERSQSGRVLVCTTQRLLNYLWMRDHLEFDVVNVSGTDVIRITGIMCPVRGRVQPTIADLAGLAFEGPSGTVPRVELGGRTLAMSLERNTGVGERWVVHLPWVALEFPE